ETPTPVARSRHVPVLTAIAGGHACSSTKSLEPAARMLGWLASMATAGSFWWFCGVLPAGLPVVTRPGLACADAPSSDASGSAVATPKNMSDDLRMNKCPPG